MELTQWNVREFNLEDASGETAFILYRPITQGWRTRHLEISLTLQKAGDRVLKQKEEANDDSPDREALSALVESQREALEVMGRFRDSLLDDLVVGSRDLTINGQEPTREQLIETVKGIEELAEKLTLHIITEGTVSSDEGKD